MGRLNISVFKYDCLSHFNWQRPTICKPYAGVVEVFRETCLKIVFVIPFSAAIVGQKLHNSMVSSVQKFLDT